MTRPRSALALPALLALAPLLVAAAAEAGPPFRRYGTAADGLDPRNPRNEVLAVDTSAPGSFGGVARQLPRGARLGDLTDLLSFKYFLADRTCGGGSPRMALLLDVDGDGFTDHEILGYAGAPPAFTGCPSGSWLFADMTDDARRWDLRFFGGRSDATWSEAIAFFESGHPGYQVTYGTLDDDGGQLQGSPPGAQGHAFYDLVTIGDATLETARDSNPSGD